MKNIFRPIWPKIYYTEIVNIYMMKNSILVYYLESVVVRGAGWLLVVADVLEVLLPDEGAHCAPPGGHVGGAVGGVGVLGTRLVH